MKKFMCFALFIAMTAWLFTPATASNIEENFNTENDSSMVPLAIVDSENFDGGGTITDTDYDGRFDGIDSSPASNYFSGTLHSSYATIPVSYNMDYRWFFGSATEYRPDLAVVSSILSSIAYHNNRINVTSGGTLSTSNDTAASDWMYFHGMSTVRHYSLTKGSDNHLSEMWVGKIGVTYNSAQKSIICVVIRGTNGTLEEWSSNFDMGTTFESPRHSEWTNTNNHKGFDITANRLNAKLNEYLAVNCDGEDCVLWITGHSRGGALANLIAAKQVDSGSSVFAYTFASPNTTQQGNACTAVKYKCIFNIVNNDDLITQIPLTDWGFRRFGVDKPRSIKNAYTGNWKSLTGMEYKCNTEKMDDVKDSFFAVAATRNDCYVAPSHGYITYLTPFYSADSAALAAKGAIESYPINTAGTCYWRVTGTAEYYYYHIYQSPAFIFQILAATIAREFTEGDYVTLDLAWYLKECKWDIAFFYSGEGFNHPHYTESYYLLAKQIS